MILPPLEFPAESYTHKMFMILTTGVKVVKLCSSSLTVGHKKLECLSRECCFRLVYPSDVLV
jgi:hypothetical protein